MRGIIFVMNISAFFQLIGGLGIFLLGMIIMVQGLRTFTGQALHDSLMRFTRTPLTGALTGAGATAVLQSSSATTVAAVGFVSAGLMTFENAIGIILGANLGTTITGWLVAILGFKLQLAALVLPLIFMGAAMKLFMRGRGSHAGLALAGFGLIFVGISTMQEAMIALESILDFSHIPADSWSSRLQLVLLGLVFTAITQSSSAGVALTLTALFSGIIEFEQAAALVIGMDVGTTITSALASMGGNAETKRTGYSHVVYNVF